MSINITFISGKPINNLKELNFQETYCEINNHYVYVFDGDPSKLVDKEKLKILKNEKLAIYKKYNDIIYDEYKKTYYELFKEKYNNISYDEINNILDTFDGKLLEQISLYKILNKYESDFIVANNESMKSEKYISILNEKDIIESILFRKENYFKHDEYILELKNIFDYIKTKIYSSSDTHDTKIKYIQYVINTLKELINTMSKNEVIFTKKINNYNEVLNNNSFDSNTCNDFYNLIYELICDIFHKYINNKINEIEHIVNYQSNNTDNLNLYEYILVGYSNYNENIKKFIDHSCILITYPFCKQQKTSNTNDNNDNNNNFLKKQDMLTIDIDIYFKKIFNEYYSIILRNKYNMNMLCKHNFDNILKTNSTIISNIDNQCTAIQNMKKIIESIQKNDYQDDDDVKDYILYKKYCHYQNDYYYFEPIVQDHIKKIRDEQNTEILTIDNEISKLLPFKSLQDNIYYVGKDYINNEYHKKQKYMKTPEYEKDKNCFYSFNYTTIQKSKFVTVINEDGTSKKVLKCVDVQVKDKIKFHTITVNIVSKSRIRLIEPDIDFNNGNDNNQFYDKEKNVYNYNLNYTILNFKDVPLDSILWELNNIKNVESVIVQ